MAKVFTRWTVLPHGPIERLEDNLWRVEGQMPDGRTRRAMVVARLADGGLVIHNAIALDEAEMGELERFGEPRILLVPNSFHRQDARIYKDRFPRLTVTCPEGARARVEQVVPVDATIEQAPADASVALEYLEGAKRLEAVMKVRSNGRVSLVFCDALLNMPKLGGVMGLFLSPTGRLSVPRVVRWFGVDDKDRLAAHLERLADTPGLARVLVGHGPTVTEAPDAAIKSAAALLAS